MPTLGKETAHPPIPRKGNSLPLPGNARNPPTGPEWEEADGSGTPAADHMGRVWLRFFPLPKQEAEAPPEAEMMVAKEKKRMPGPKALSTRLPRLWAPGSGCAPTPRAAPRQPSRIGPALIAAPTPSLSLPARMSVKLSVSARFEGLRRALIGGRGRGN